MSEKRTHRFKADQDDIAAGMDVMSWLREEIAKQYGPRAVITALDVDTQWDIGSGEMVINVHLAFPKGGVMELWSTRHGSSSEAMLRKAGGEYCILSVTLGNTEQNISLDRKDLKDLFNAIGNEIGYWDEPTIDRHEVVMTREIIPRKRPPVIVPSPIKVEETLTPEQWRESYAHYLAHYLAQSETLTVTDIHFDASKIDPENLEWAVAETKRVFGNRVIVEVFRSEQ